MENNDNRMVLTGFQGSLGQMTYSVLRDLPKTERSLYSLLMTDVDRLDDRVSRVRRVIKKKARD